MHATNYKYIKTHNQNKLRHIGIKGRTVYRSEQEPTWQAPLWTLVQDPHTDVPR